MNDIARRDWEQMYTNKFTAEPQTFSQKWRWHYSYQPYVRGPEASKYDQFENYKRSGPKYSEMYKRSFAPANPFGYGFVDSMGDL